MGIDAKYGRVTTESGTIGEDEPVVVFRAKDKHLPAVLTYYKNICDKSPKEHLHAIEATRRKVFEWQRDHADLLKVPD